MKTTLLFIASMFVALAVAFLAATAERMFAGVKFLECEEEKGRKFYRFRIANALAGAGQEGWIKAIVLGLIAGVINFTAPQVGSMLWLAPIMRFSMKSTSKNKSAIVALTVQPSTALYGP